MADPRAAKPPTLVSFGTKGRNGGSNGGGTSVPGTVIANGTNIDPIPKAICLCAAGNIEYIPADNGTITHKVTGAPAGWCPPHRVKQVVSATVDWFTVEDTGI